MEISNTELTTIQVQSDDNRIIPFSSIMPSEDQGLLIFTIPYIDSIATQIQIRKLRDQVKILEKYNFKVICVTTDSIETVTKLEDMNCTILFDFTRKLSKYFGILGKENFILRRILLFNHKMELLKIFTELSPYNFVDELIVFLQLSLEHNYPINTKTVI